jgi:phosphatidate cytidylyltransferase
VIGAVLGGAVFAAIFAAIGLGVYYELSRMTPLIGLGFRLGWPGYAVVFAAAALALLSPDAWAIAAFCALAILLPVLMIFRMPISAESFSAWIATLAAGAYVGFAVFAAISLRRAVGDLEVDWASDLGAFFTLGDDSHALGMAWTMVAILATWLADTFALFVGRSFGRTPLIPHISPKKTLEGAAGGVLGAVVAVILLTVLLGIPDVSIPLAIAIGVLLAVVGICGDLMESFIKRSAGVKDSGALIPGHGGVFDRVDALLPTFLVTWAIAQVLS